MKLLAPVLASILLPLALAAETQRFRSGELLCAELSTELPRIHNNQEADLSNLPEQKIYVALTVSLDIGRRISIYDYSIKAFGATYRCIALRNGDDSIDGEKFESFGDGKDRRCTLYFALNAREIGQSNPEKLLLVCNAPPTSEQPVLFVNCGTRPFTQPGKIPASGVMTALP